MLTEQTYLSTIFIIFFAIIAIGYKVVHQTRSHALKKSSTNVLVINYGETKNFSANIISYLEKHATVEVKNITDSNSEELETQTKKYSRIIFLWKVGNRVLDPEIKLIEDLYHQFKNNFRVIYLSGQGSIPYYVLKNCDQEVSIALKEIYDEKAVAKSLKGFIDIINDEGTRRIRIVFFFIVLLWIGSLLGYFQSKGRAFDISQSYEDLLKRNEKLVKENNEMREFLNEKDFQIQALENEKEKLISESQNLMLEIRELKRKEKNLSELLNQEKERNRVLEAENQKLKEMLIEAKLKLEQSEKALHSHKDETSRLMFEIEKRYKKELRDLEDKMEDQNRNTRKSVEVLDKKLSENLFYYWGENIQTFCSSLFS